MDAEPILKITPAAQAKIKGVMEGQSVPQGYALRVGVRGQAMGCAGVSYMLGFDQPAEGDIADVVAGIKVVISPAHSMFVMGMEIDWHEDENQQGFVFNNPSKKVDAS